jgi:hypothetical protein
MFYLCEKLKNMEVQKYVLLDADDVSIVAGTIDDLNNYWQGFGDDYGGDNFLSDCKIHKISEPVDFWVDNGFIQLED